LKFLNLILMLYSSQTMACCLQNQGICGDECCDGMMFSKIDCGHKFIELPTTIKPNLEYKKNSVESPSNWLYIWTDSNTNIPHLSSTFPPWYRNPLYPENYPRVLVYDEYNRLIDDTGTKIGKQEASEFRQQAITNLKQQEQYNKISKLKSDEKIKQERLKYLQANWSKTGIISTEMQQLLTEQVEKKQITIAMNEEQVLQAWGIPESNIKEIIDNKVKKVLIYKQGKILLVDDIVKSIQKN